MEDMSVEEQHLAGPHPDPNIYTLGDCSSDGNKTICKRISDGCLERSIKRRNPSEGCSQTRDPSAGSPSAYTGPPDGTANSTTEDAGISAPTITSICGEAEGRKQKRKSEETEGPRKRSHKTDSPSEAPSNQATSQASSSDSPDTSSSPTTAHCYSRATFEAKYEEEEVLVVGAFGSVYAGHCKEDNLPLLNGKISMVPLEVALLLKVKPEAGGTSAAVSLLDWYDLDDGLILILERPVPCMDLTSYMDSKGSVLEEQEAKIMAKQLVDALIEIHSRGVFHRDIKLDNILIETNSDVPRVRIIDFGCGTLLRNRMPAELGTDVNNIPEALLCSSYSAETTTVRQLGIVLCEILSFHSAGANCEDPDDSCGLSIDCQNFLQSCVEESPADRHTLEKLKHHSWLM